MTSDLTLVFIAGSMVMAGIAIIGQRRLIYGKQYEVHQDRFFKAVGQLIDDGRTPEPVLEYLDCMAAMICNKNLARHALWSILTGKSRTIHERPPEHFKRFKLAITEMPNDLMPWLAGATVSFAFAVSFRSVYLGWLLRRVLFQLSSKVSQTPNGATIDRAEPVLLEIEPMACAA